MAEMMAKFNAYSSDEEWNQLMKKTRRTRSKVIEKKKKEEKIRNDKQTSEDGDEEENKENESVNGHHHHHHHRNKGDEEDSRSSNDQMIFRERRKKAFIIDDRDEDEDDDKDECNEISPSKSWMLDHNQFNKDDRVEDEGEKELYEIGLKMSEINLENQEQDQIQCNDHNSMDESIINSIRKTKKYTIYDDDGDDEDEGDEKSDDDIDQVSFIVGPKKKHFVIEDSEHESELESEYKYLIGKYKHIRDLNRSDTSSEFYTGNGNVQSPVITITDSTTSGDEWTQILNSKKKSFKKSKSKEARNSRKSVKNMKISKNQSKYEFNGNNLRLINDPTLDDPISNPDINNMFKLYDKYFFEKDLIRNEVYVTWNGRMTRSAGLTKYNTKTLDCSIHLSKQLLKMRPKKDLIETMLHEMIHAYLFVLGRDRESSHGPLFRKHMQRLNKLTGLNITIYHSFHDEVNLIRSKHIWRCDGICMSMAPKYGYVKRAVNRKPGPYDFWWKSHQNFCGGTFTKICDSKLDQVPIIN